MIHANQRAVSAAGDLPRKLRPGIVFWFAPLTGTAIARGARITADLGPPGGSVASKYAPGLVTSGIGHFWELGVGIECKWRRRTCVYPAVAADIVDPQ